MTGPVTHPRFAARRGAVRASTWWGKAWIRAVEEAAYSEQDLKRSRGLARGGHVGGIAIGPGSVVAAVRDGDDLWSVRWSVPTLDTSDVALLVDLVASESGRIATLLGGDLPQPLVEEAEDSGVELLPFGGELSAECPCGAWVDPCPHALAVAYQAGWLVDADPLALTGLRGLARDDLLAALHARHPIGDSIDSVDSIDSARVHDPDFEAGLDAALRAARILQLLARGDADIDHLW